MNIKLIISIILVALLEQKSATAEDSFLDPTSSSESSSSSSSDLSARSYSAPSSYSSSYTKSSYLKPSTTYLKPSSHSYPTYSAPSSYSKLSSSYSKAHSSYSGSSSSYAAPHCPTNYIVSCKPSMYPVPCSSYRGSSNYGSSGAYSMKYPMYILPHKYYC
uniref:VM domain-containing protein n=1 Tax=Megaselia scalaris TaxID=36166 RepID=T1GIC6_MEGSC